MINSIINASINHSIKNLSKMNYLNDKTLKKNKLKFNHTDLKQTNFFKPTTNVVLDNKINSYNVQYTDESKVRDIFFQRSKIVNKNNQNLEQQILKSDIQKINHVYKINFQNAESSGFGDFIRGSYFLLEFCEKNNIEIDLHIYDSNIKHFLSYFNKKPTIPVFVANNIHKFIPTNANFTHKNEVIGYEINVTHDNEFIKYLNDCELYNNNVYINTINFPGHNINSKHLEYMKCILEPTEFLKNEVDNLLNYFNLEKHNYTTYHIRLGDEFLENQSKSIQLGLINKIINKLRIDANKNYLLLSDSISIKRILKTKYPNILVLQNKSVHTLNNDANGLKNTLLDFYLMSYSSNIISFSIYDHGSGFSKWCAITYNIPYICYSL
jgi:hypothetical protein